MAAGLNTALSLNIHLPPSKVPAAMTASLQSTFGSAFIGLVVSAILYGVTILQTYLYYRCRG
ncbi:hypothetical protein B0H10DRAFT_2025927 [Mycena sp. CBHHK59/15]|nr:hypothetical protein B0H10DRAFT_2025927 [Mycena sp. CBHHK59/15]